MGTLPSELTINWPAPPRIEQTVEISAPPDDGELRVEQAHTRLIIATNLERLTLAASDIEVQVNEGVHIGKLFIERALKRFWITGGSFGSIEMATLTDYSSTPPVSNEAWLIEDVLVNNVQVITVVPEDLSALDNQNTFSGFYLKGKRIALLNSRVQAFHYSVWVWANTDTSDFPCEDIILAGNVFESAGLESTVRLVSVQRSVVVDNQFVNVGKRFPDGALTLKHNYRIHGRSDLNFAGRNTLLKGGLKFVSEPNDFVGTVWFINNVMYHFTSPGGVLDLGSGSDVVPLTARLRYLFMTNNVIFSEAVMEQLLENVPRQWRIENNYYRRLPQLEAG